MRWWWCCSAVYPRNTLRLSFSSVDHVGSTCQDISLSPSADSRVLVRPLGSSILIVSMRKSANAHKYREHIDNATTMLEKGMYVCMHACMYVCMYVCRIRPFEKVGLAAWWPAFYDGHLILFLFHTLSTQSLSCRRCFKLWQDEPLLWPSIDPSIPAGVTSYI